jgi:hypothetical protein
MNHDIPPTPGPGQVAESLQREGIDRARASASNTIQENEALAARLRAETAKGDGAPEGTLESLERCARMLNQYAPDCFPANEQGQIDFARAMMESVADEIMAFIANTKKGG